MKYAKQRDVNEKEIVAALLAAGAHVTRLGDAGVPDLLVGYACRWTLIEVKLPLGKRGGRQLRGGTHAGGDGVLTAAQVKWWSGMTAACGPAAVVRTPDEALVAIGARP